MYVDPGTIGLIYQLGFLIISGIAGILLFFFRPIINIFKRIFKLKDKKESPTTSATEEGRDP